MFSKTYQATHPDMMEQVANQQLRDRYLVTGLFAAERVVLNYSHNERFIIGGAAPITAVVALPDQDRARTGRRSWPGASSASSTSGPGRAALRSTRKPSRCRATMVCTFRWAPRASHSRRPTPRSPRSSIWSPRLRTRASRPCRSRSKLPCRCGAVLWKRRTSARSISTSFPPRANRRSCCSALRSCSQAASGIRCRRICTIGAPRSTSISGSERTIAFFISWASPTKCGTSSCATTRP